MPNSEAETESETETETAAEAAPAPKRSSVVPLAALAVVACLGVAMVTQGADTSSPPQPSADQAVSSPAYNSALWTLGKSAPAPTPLPYSVPVRIKIPEIGVDAPITSLGLTSDGHLNAPSDTDRNLVGWYGNGPAPGMTGNSILDGHVDTMAGPAVFYGLGALSKGDTVRVTRADKLTAVYSIDGIEVYAKADFPSDRVYGATKDPELRLITCGGGYTKQSGYLGNVVVYAHLISD